MGTTIIGEGATVAEAKEAIGIEPSLMRHYKLGKTCISAAQKKKIESGIHALADELRQISL